MNNQLPVRYIHLDELGLPHIRCYSDGRIYDEITNNWLSGGKKDVYLSDHLGHSYSISRSRLYGYCFRAPWRQNFVYPYRQLTDLGFPNYVACYTGKIFGFHKMDYLQEDISPDGYPECVLVDPSGKLHYFKTHRLIALAFVPNPENKETVNHIDGNKLNNWVTNLEWVHEWENMDHALKTGLKHLAVTDEQVHAICRDLSTGNYESYAQLARRYGLKTHNITDLLDGCHYRISRQYQNIPYDPNARHIPKEFR